MRTAAELALLALGLWLAADGANAWVRAAGLVLVWRSARAW